MRTNLSVQYSTHIICAKTGKCLKKTPKKKNLVLDYALQALAQALTPGGSNPASCFTVCKVGSGNNANRFPSGAITFTQVGTTLTASAPFFTAAMVGGIFKYGTNTTGQEYYITGFTSNLVVTLDTSASFVAIVGTVWMVQQTALQTQSFETSTYQTLSGDCQTTYATNTMIHKRTFVFPVQASPYTVNEIGWGKTAGAEILGRAVLSSSDVIGPTNFYVVVLTLTFTVTPGTPTANANFGTGINTAGNTMLEMFSFGIVNSSGGVASPVSGQGRVMDGLGAGVQGVEFWLNDWTQNANITSNGSGPALPAGRISLSTPAWVYGSARGKMTLTCTLSTTTSGQTCYGLGMHSGASPFNIAFDCHFTTPQTLPVGSFAPTVVLQSIYNRILDNA